MFYKSIQMATSCVAITKNLGNSSKIWFKIHKFAIIIKGVMIENAFSPEVQASVWSVEN